MNLLPFFTINLAGLQCPLGTSFSTIGDKSIHEDYRDKEWYLRKCESKYESLYLN